MTQLFTAEIIYTGPEAEGNTTDLIGVFSTREKAEAAMLEYMESVLEIERPGFELVSKQVREWELDRSVVEETP